MKNKNLISVVIPFFNSENFLEKCLTSLLNQEHTNFEVILVDDQSTDESQKIAMKFANNDKRFKLFVNKSNMGAAYSRSLAIKKSKGEFVAILDSDDIALPNRFVKQLDYLTSNPKIDILGSAAEEFNTTTGESAIRKHYLKHEGLIINLLTDMPFINSSLMFRSRCFEKLEELYDETFVPAEDFELLVRLKEKGCYFENISDVLVKRHLHKSSITHTKQKNLEQARLHIIAFQLGPYATLNKLLYHLEYGNKLITYDLSIEFLKNKNKFKSMLTDVRFQSFYGEENWRKHVSELLRKLIQECKLKLGWKKFYFIKTKYELINWSFGN